MYILIVFAWAVFCSSLNAVLPNEPRNSVSVCACVWKCVYIFHMDARWDYLGLLVFQVLTENVFL